MDSAKQQLVDKLKNATNILVTVSKDPSVDQLAACIGLTLLLTKLNKHSVAVFSGKVPSTIEFLKPDETLQKNTDSLRDFIIALDKNKADKLRYKVENNVVRIFITPYKTSISEKDLEFSEGDFNVDVVVALGVQKQQDLDGAIVAHGRILHDATVTSINIGAEAGLGSINWHEPQASSLSELVTALVPMFGDNLLDTQIATALLTGIVAETKRFSNEKTSPQAMSASSSLMAAGANQQLVATKLEESAQAAAAGTEPQADATIADDGTLNINHKSDSKAPKAQSKLPAAPAPPPAAPAAPAAPPAPKPAPPKPKIQPPPAEPKPAANDHLTEGAKLMTEPPRLGGNLSANTQPEGLEPVTDPLSMPDREPDQLLSRAPASPASAFTPPPTNWQPSAAPPPSPAPSPSPPAIIPDSGGPISSANPGDETLTDLEKAVNSPHLDTTQLGSARDQVNQAFQTGPSSPAPALSPPSSGSLEREDVQQVANSPLLPVGPAPPESSITSPTPPPSPDSLSPTPGIADSKAPPVPPPIPFQFGNDHKTPPTQPPPAQ